MRIDWGATTLAGVNDDGVRYWRGVVVLLGPEAGDIVDDGPPRASEAEAQADADDLVSRLRDARDWAETAASLAPGRV